VCLVGWCLLLCLPSAAIFVSNGGSGVGGTFIWIITFPKVLSNQIDCLAVGIVLPLVRIVSR
jgi:hypothetical protein